MAAKLLHSLTDDNPDLQKQIGCMTGIFQLFDRQQILSGRRISGYSQNRLPPSPGNFHFNNSTLDGSSNVCNRQAATEKYSNKSMNEKQRASTESSRASFSSSSRSSSFSSLDCNKPTQTDQSSFDRIIFPDTPSRDPVMNHPSVSPQFFRQSLDLRDVVKDSMYREARGLSVKTTTKDEELTRVLSHRDSPRPVQLSKSVDGSYGVGVSGKLSLPADLKESLRVLAKLREAPWYFNDARELSRSSYDVKEGSLLSTPKDLPRFSYDGRELNRSSFDSRDPYKSNPKLKELPRLSLDGREGSMRSSNADLKLNCEKSLGNNSHGSPNLHQTLESYKRPPNVVAKLMGLENLPDLNSTQDSQVGPVKTSNVHDSGPFSKSLKAINPGKPFQTSNSTASRKDLTSPRWKNTESVMKPISNSRYPIEPAPWRLLEGGRGLQKPAASNVKAPSKASNSFPSVYSEIEKRLKDLEFKQSGKDLRALKQILEAMQAKGLLASRKEEQTSNWGLQRDYEPKHLSPVQNSRLINQRCQQTTRSANSSRTLESPIVIMKPAKLVEKSGIPASSVIPIDGLQGLHKVRGSDLIDSRKNSVITLSTKDQTPRNSRRDTVVSSNDKKIAPKNPRLTQTSTKPQQVPKENTTCSVKSSGSVSPRLQQRKLELEKRSRLPTPSSDLSKPRRQSNKQQTVSDSPGGRLRRKALNLQQSDDQLSDISSETRNLSYQEEGISLQADCNVTPVSKTSTVVTSIDSSPDFNGSHSPSAKASKYSISSSKQNKSTPRFKDDGAPAELATVSPEQPSPVSVLDGSVYRDDTPSPVKQVPNKFTGDGIGTSKDITCEYSWSQVDMSSDGMASGSSPKPEISRKKLQNIENLVQKLRQLNSTHDETSTDYIASLCENTNPDHRYISEILLASGLLLRDLNSSLTTFQLHPSGHHINPELFFVLEQTKPSSLHLKEESNPGKVNPLKLDHEKFHRKLVFDAVNEILVRKLAPLGLCTEPWLRPSKLAKKTLGAQRLLKELCSEIEQLQTSKQENLVDEGDSLKGILWEDVIHRSENWTVFHAELSGVVLDVERMVFKDLIDEVVRGEAATLQAKPNRRRKQSFK
ncbi:protein of unknown function DUF4378 [Dillenia turbinata]|uniref:DUF4378 domain-containing protein n=1 Tax=Dillenia turbinata TaxID=194707 RepID=A0AAN8US56_9MAGN